MKMRRKVKRQRGWDGGDLKRSPDQNSSSSGYWIGFGYEGWVWNETTGMGTRLSYR